MTTQLHRCSSNAIDRVFHGVSFVVGLLEIICPLAVVWLVSLIVVLAVDGMLFRRAFAHVSQEARVVEPSGAHLNPTSAVIGILRERGLIASAQHDAPDAICFGEAFAAPGVPVLDPILLAADTARFTSARFEVLTPDGFIPAAVTLADHAFYRIASLCDERFADGDANELAKTLADERSLVDHNIESSIVVISGRHGLPTVPAAFNPLKTAHDFKDFSAALTHLHGKNRGGGGMLVPLPLI